MMRTWRYIIVLAITLIPVTSHGLVATSNGDYFVSFIDIELPSDSADATIRVNRAYNSRSQFRGMFGYGWGNDFDAYLIPSADGSVVIQESGGGESVRFSREGMSEQELRMLIDRIVDAKVGKLASNALLFDKEAYSAQLMADANFRDEEARELDRTRELPAGAVVRSSVQGDQSITRLITGYVRDNGRGVREFYEHKGSAYDRGVAASDMRKIHGVYRISQVEDSNSHRVVSFSYDPANGNLLRVTSDRGSYFEFTYDDLGLVIKIENNVGETAVYQYCSSVSYDSKQHCQQADLISETDSSGKTYAYAYDELHNVIEIESPGRKIEKIEYWPLQNGGGTKTVRLANGVTMEYDYWDDPAGPNLHYRTGVLTTFSSGRSFLSTYEYWRKRKKDGSSYKYRLVMKTGGDVSETIYNECCEQPERIIENGNVTEFDYYPDSGRPREKRTSDEIVNWEYSKTSAFKITKLTIKDRVSERLRVEFKYQYDDQGLLVDATSSSGQRAQISYDADRRIASVTDEKGNKLRFDYNPKGKPAKIALEGVGAIVITYDTDGQIQDVAASSPQNPEVSARVSSMFQSLLELVKPAEMNL